LSQLSELSQRDFHYRAARKNDPLESDQWVQAMQLLLKSLQAGSVIVLISDFIDWPNRLLEYCHRLDQRGQLLMYQVVDPVEGNSEKENKTAVSIQFTDGITSEFRLLNGTTSVNNLFLDNTELHRYHTTSVSTHLTLVEQLAARLQ
jgi:hypothetical protein